MFGMSITEIGLILVLGLIVFGPERIPTVARTVGRFIRDMRRTASDIQRTFEVEDIRRELRERNASGKSASGSNKAVSADAPPDTPLPEASSVPEDLDSDDAVAATLRGYLDEIAALHPDVELRAVTLAEASAVEPPLRVVALPEASAETASDDNRAVPLASPISRSLAS